MTNQVSTSGSAPGQDSGGWYDPSNPKQSAQALLTIIANELQVEMLDSDSLSEPAVGLEEAQRDGSKVTRNVAIDSQFALAVAKAQSFLQKLEQHLHAADMLAVNDGVLSESQSALFNLQPNPIVAAIHDAFAPLEAEARAARSTLGSNHPDLQAYRNYAGQLLGQYTDTAHFCRAARLQSMGPGSFLIINHILDNTPSGSTLVGHLVDRLFLDADVAIAHRQRVVDLVEVLGSLFSQIPEGGLDIKSYACGPARAYEELFRPRTSNSPSSPGALVTSSYEDLWGGETGLANLEQFNLALYDLNADALQYAIAQIGLQLDQRNYVPFDGQLASERSNAFRRILAYQKKGSGEPTIPRHQDSSLADFLDCSGLIDYLPDQLTNALTVSLFDGLKPGGYLLVTAVAHNDPHRGVREMALNWPLVTRGREELQAIAKAVKDWTVAVAADPDAPRKPPSFEGSYRDDIRTNAALSLAIREGTLQPGQYCVIDGYVPPGETVGLNQYLVMRRNME